MIKKLLVKSKKLLNKFIFLFQEPSFRKMIVREFDGKSVAIVGGAKVIGKGGLIDSHDVVVRINMPRNDCIRSSGLRTDICFLGANVSDKKYDEYMKELFSKVPNDAKVISTKKNKSRKEWVGNEVLFYNPLIPVIVTKKISKELGVEGDFLDSMGGTPRSGFVCVVAILIYGNPKKISVFGMSRDVCDAFKTVDGKGDDLFYDKENFLSKHCHPSKEISMLERVVIKFPGKVVWE